MVHTCNRCQGRMHLVRKWPHPTLWPPKVLARYICPECGTVRECTEDGDSDCVDMTPETMRDVEYYRAQSESCAQMAEMVSNPEEKGRWLRLAEQWRQLAEEIKNLKEPNAGPQ